MYSTKLLNNSLVPGNAYITVGDPYNDPKPNPFRQGKKGEKLTPFQVKVRNPSKILSVKSLFTSSIISTDDSSKPREWIICKEDLCT
jgi:hypothetical protein